MPDKQTTLHPVMADALSPFRPKDGEQQKAKHTPGPWRINPAPNAKHEIVADGECMVICRTTEKLFMKSATANAHLIAAAPELLEALRVAERAIDDCQTYRSHLHHKELALVRGAIAKAEGR